MTPSVALQIDLMNAQIAQKEAEIAIMKINITDIYNADANGTLPQEDLMSMVSNMMSELKGMK